MHSVECLLPKKAIEDICRAGNNRPAIVRWREYLGFSPSREECEKLLAGHDCVEPGEKLADLQNKVLWIAAWNRFDRTYEDRR